MASTQFLRRPNVVGSTTTFRKRHPRIAKLIKAVNHPVRWIFAAAISLGSLSVISIIVFLFALASPNANAACASGACITGNQPLLNVDTSQGQALDLLFSSLLPGTDIQLSVLEWSALAGADVNLELFTELLAAEANVANASELANADVTLLQFLNVAAQAAENDGNVAAAEAIGLMLLQLNEIENGGPVGQLVQTATFPVSSILDIDFEQGNLADIDLNLLDLVSGGVEAFNSENAIAPQPIGIANDSPLLEGLGLGGIARAATIETVVVEPSSIRCGPVGTVFNSATVRMKITLDLLNLDIADSPAVAAALGGVSTLLGPGINVSAMNEAGQLTVYLDIGRAEATLLELDVPSQTAALRVVNGVTDLYIGEFDDGQFFDRTRSLNPDTDLEPAVISTLDVDIEVPLVGNTTVNLDITARSHSQSDNNETILYFAPPLPDTQSTDPQGFNASALIGNLVDNLEVNTGLRGGGTVDGGFDPVLSALGIGTDLLLDTLQPVLDEVVDDAVLGLVTPLISGLVDSVIADQLGISIGSATFTMLGAGAYCETIGRVYFDDNYNGNRDGAESGPRTELFIKAVPSAGGETIVVPVDPESGYYNLGFLPPRNYRLVLDNNDNSTDVTPTLPAGYLNVEQRSGQQMFRVNGGSSPQDFGIFQGSRVDIFSFVDIGEAPNNGLAETDETGLNQAPITLFINGEIVAAGRTGTSGQISLLVAHTETIELSICQGRINGYYNSGGQPAAQYEASSNCVNRTLEPGGQLIQDQRITFGNIPVSRFTASGRQAAPAGATIDYQHQFTAGTAGNVTFSSEAEWNSTLLVDADCNGVVDEEGNSEQVLAETTTVAVGETLCFIARVAVPEDAEAGNRDLLKLAAAFTPTNIDQVTETRRLVDLSYAIDGNGNGGITLEKSSDKQQARPGESLTYRLSYSNLTNNPISEIVINDALPAWTTLEEASCEEPMPAGLIACNVTIGIGDDGGGVRWELPGTLQPGESGAVEFRVRLEP